ncbi:MAG: F0F1 ATP synthase subunit B [Candidatus Margulisbacteria bacterium]|nr:F0F1 ATP synthase subunit B [Candidatus Margulisiibacteriota bacterium]
MFEIDTGLIFWTALSFLILLALLYKLVFPPLQRILGERRQAIEGGLARAKKAQEEAEDLLKKYQTQLAEAERTTASILEDARRKSQNLRDETLKTAQKEAYEVLENTRKDIDLYKEKALTDLKADIARIIVEVTGRLVKKTLKPEDHAKLIESSIEELEKHAPG